MQSKLIFTTGINNVTPKGSLLVFSDDWERHPSSCQHLVAQLADDYRVVWVNTIGTRRPRLDWSTLRRGWEKAGHWLMRQEEEPCDPRVRVTSPLMWPWFSKGRDRWLNRMLLRRQLEPLLADLPRPVIGLSTLPIVAGLVGNLPVDRWIYYCVDDFSKWPGLDQAALGELEKKLVAKVDAVVAVSNNLVQRMEQLGRTPSLLTHGVDAGFWRSDPAHAAHVHEILGAYEPPYVLFWGVVDQRMDRDWLAALSAELKHGSIVLVGPHDRPDPSLGRLPRVHCPGPVPLAALPRLAVSASALIMPYRDLPVTRAMQPLKLKEYLATARPVVTRRLPAVEEWSDCLDAVETSGAFAKAVAERISTGLPLVQQQARGRIAGQSWASKARQLEKVLLADVPPAAARPHLQVASSMATPGNV